MAAITYVNLESGKETTVHQFTLTDEEKKPTGGGVIVGLTPQAKLGYDRQSDRIYFGMMSGNGRILDDNIIFFRPTNCQGKIILKLIITQQFVLMFKR